jgi:hypothetical protein
MWSFCMLSVKHRLFDKGRIGGRGRKGRVGDSLFDLTTADDGVVCDFY